MFDWSDKHQYFAFTKFESNIFLLALQLVTDNFQDFLYKIINSSKMIF
jgi:hypothetical protein